LSEALSHELPVGQVLATLWRQRWIITITTIVALVAGFLYVARRGTIWRASSRIYVERSGPSILSADSLLMAAGKDHASTQAELLRSTPILKAALARPEIGGSPVFDEVDNRVAWLKKYMHVTVGRKNDIISVSLDSKLVAEACAVVNAVVDAYMEFHSKRKRSTAKEILDHLTAQREKHRQELVTIQAALTRFLKENSTIGLDRNGATNFELDRLREASNALAKAQQDEAAAKAELEQARMLAKKPGLMREILQIHGGRSVSADVSRLKSEVTRKIWGLEARRTEILVQVTPEHPAVTAIDEQIQRLRTQKGEIESDAEVFAQQYIAYLEGRLATASRAVAEQQNRVDDQKRRYKDLGSKRVDYLALETQRTQTQDMIDDLTGRISQINLADISEDEKGLLNIQILDPAKVETATVASSRAAVIAIFLCLGLMAGFGLGWIRGSFDQRLRTAEDLAVAVELPLLGMIPRTSLDSAEEDAISGWDAHPLLAEAARSLRTAVYFGVPKGQGRVIQVTSPESGDGKSTITSLLAIAMAQAGQRTLVIDADLRKPDQANRFQLHNEIGLATVLAELDDVDEVIQRTRVDNLEVMVAGPIPVNPTEMLNGNVFEDLLVELKQSYDRILIDSPPVLPVADARIIAAKCDFTILAFRVDKSTRKRAVAAHEAILSVGSRVLGGVLNDMPHGIGYGYGGGYGYGPMQEQANGSSGR